jgi:hypothetical protein
MVNKGQQFRMKRIVERLFTESCMPLPALEKELLKLGFIQTGGDLLALKFENMVFSLFLEILLDENRCVHSYRVVPLEEKDGRQQKFRW